MHEVICGNCHCNVMFAVAVAVCPEFVAVTVIVAENELGGYALGAVYATVAPELPMVPAPETVHENVADWFAVAVNDSVLFGVRSTVAAGGFPEQAGQVRETESC